MRKSGSLSITLIISGVLLVVGSTFLLGVLPNMLKPATSIWLGNGVFRTDIASTPGARQKGLSNKSELAVDQALLMVFPNEGKWGIWMKDMNFPIDIVWLNKDKKVVYIVKNASNNDPTKVYTPGEAAKYVIELPAGTADGKSIISNSVANFQIDNEEVK
jgi:uncharacterized membrane protein (UPF0127 family)